MTKTQFLLFFIVIIPFINAGLISIARGSRAVLSIISMILPGIFVINVGALLLDYLQQNYDSLVLISLGRQLKIVLAPDSLSLGFLMLLSFLWFIITCYGNGYFSSSEDKKLYEFKLFGSVIIGFITTIILSKNLLTLLVFYQSLFFALHFFNNYFMRKSDIRSSYNFTSLSLFCSFALFCAIVLTYKIAGEVEFASGGILNDNVSDLNYILLSTFYLLGIATIIFAPVYLTYGGLYYLAPPIISIVFISAYALVMIFCLFKIIAYVFGVEIFFAFYQASLFKYFLLGLLGLNLFTSAALAIFNNNLKKILIYLFFNQLIYVILVIFIFGTQINKAALAAFGFIFGQILIFFTIGNINKYLLASSNKSLSGMIFQLPLNSAAFIFGLLSILGLVPGIALLEKYFLLKKLFVEHNLLGLLIVAGNLILCAIIIIRIIGPMVTKNGAETDENSSENDSTIARKMERDWRLILPLLAILAVMIIGLILPQTTMWFFKRIF